MRKDNEYCEDTCDRSDCRQRGCIMGNVTFKYTTEETDTNYIIDTVRPMEQDETTLLKPLVVNFYGGPGSGKCLKKGTKVLKYDGSFVNVEEININDKLMGIDSSPRNVIELSKGKEKLYKIYLRNGNVFEVTGNHILSLRSSTNFNGISKGQIINITVLDFLNKSKKFQQKMKFYKTSCINFNTNNNILIDPYYIGLWLGDGNSDDPSRITTNDKEIVNYLNDFSLSLNENFTVKKVGNSKYCYSITQGNVGGKSSFIRQSFKYYNLENNKHIPKEYLLSSKKDRLKLLAGLIDSDGYSHENNYEICSKFENLTNDIKFLCQSLGYYVNVSIKHNNQYNKDYYRIYISGDNLHEIPVLLGRKKKQQKTFKNNKTNIGITKIIQNDYEDDYYGFELDDDKLFIMEDFFVTHNSTTAAGLFHFLKMAEVNCELITEFAKDLTWAEAPKAMKYQPYLFGEQGWRLERLTGLVDVVVTDSPLILSSIYATPEMPQAWHDFVLWEHKRRNTLDFFLKRVKSYNPIGRSQTEDEAKAIDEKILDTLTKMGVKFHEVLTGDGTAAIRAFGIVMKTLGKE